jgi:hypothetical protein
MTTQRIAVTGAIASNAAALLLPLPVFAQDVSPPLQASPPAPSKPDKPPARHISPFYFGITGGSLGVGPEVSYALSRHVDLRGNVTFLDFSHRFHSGGIPYYGEAHLGSGGLMLDYRPFGGGFFLSAGARLNKNKLRANSTLNGSVVVSGVTYTASRIGTLRGYGDFRPVAPTLSLGYAGTLRRGFKLGIEAGAMFMGGARVYPFSYTGRNVSASRLEAQRASLQHNIDKYQVYPILQLTAGYRF